jgi:hypothetical protein
VLTDDYHNGQMSTSLVLFAEKIAWLTSVVNFYYADNLAKQKNYATYSPHSKYHLLFLCPAQHRKERETKRET